MAKSVRSPYTPQDRADFQTLHSAITEALRVSIDATVSAVSLGAYLKEVKDRGLWKLDLAGTKRGSFYTWVSDKYPIRKTMTYNYLVIGAALSQEEVAGRRISIKSLQVISSADKALHRFLLELADKQESSSKVAKALAAAREALSKGASLHEAETRGREAMAQRVVRPKRTAPAPSPTEPPPVPLSIEEALLQALQQSSGSAGLPAEQLDRLEALARELLSSLAAMRQTPGQTPGQTGTAVNDSPGLPKLPPAPVATEAPAAPRSSELLQKPMPHLVPLLVTLSVLAAQPIEPEEDTEYLLRLDRPKTSVLLAIPPDVPPVPRKLVNQIEPLLHRLAGLYNSALRLNEKQYQEALFLAKEAGAIASSGVLGLHPLLVRPLEWLATLALYNGDFGKALCFTDQILEIWAKFDTRDQGQVLEWRSFRGIVLARLGRIQQARRILQQVYEERKQRFKADHPLVKVAKENYQNLF